MQKMVTRARFERATPSFGGCSGESHNILFSLRYFRILVRSRHAMRCQEMPRGDTVIGFAVGIGTHSLAGQALDFDVKALAIE